MPGLYSRFIKPIHFTGDILLINTSFLLSYYLVFDSFDSYFKNHYLGFILYYNIAWIVTGYLLNVYKLYRVSWFLGILLNLIKSLLFYFLLIVAFSGFANTLNYSKQHILLTFAFTSAFIVIWRLTILVMLRLYRKSGHNYRKVVIAGFGEAALDLHDFFISHPEHGYRFEGFFEDSGASHPEIKGKVSELQKFVMDNDVDEIYCSMPHMQNGQLLSIMDFADNNFIRVKLIPDVSGIPYKQFKLDLYGFMPVIAVRSLPLDEGFNKYLKWGFDLVFSAMVCLLLLSWLLPLLGLLIKLDSKGPVFFRQKRSGLNNREFWCLKLRTMHVNHEANIKQASLNDPRVTRIGKFLRKYSLDELPQFLNVLFGDMSVVGPRPHMLRHTEEYSRIIEKYMLRHFIKPGITGLSQTIGLRGETSDSSLMRKRVKVDIFYIENWSFFMDMKIIVKTVLNVLRGDKSAF